NRWTRLTSQFRLPLRVAAAAASRDGRRSTTDLACASRGARPATGVGGGASAGMQGSCCVGGPHGLTWHRGLHPVLPATLSLRGRLCHTFGNTRVSCITRRQACPSVRAARTVI